MNKHILTRTFKGELKWMNEAIRETRECRYGKLVRTNWVNHQCRFTTGSTAYTKPLFCLVKCTILALCPDAVSDESHGGFDFTFSWSHVLPGLKGDELQRCPVSDISGGWEFLPSWKLKKSWGTSAEILGSLLNGKSRPKPGTLKGSGRVLAHILIFSESKRS